MYSVIKPKRESNNLYLLGIAELSNLCHQSLHAITTATATKPFPSLGSRAYAVLIASVNCAGRAGAGNSVSVRALNARK